MTAPRVRCAAAGAFRDKHQAVERWWTLTDPDGTGYALCSAACVLTFITYREWPAEAGEREARVSDRTDKLIAALMAFADKRGHWPRCPRTREMGRSTMMDDDGTEILTPCSKKCTTARQAVEAAGGMVIQPLPIIRGPRDKRTLADLFPGRCSLVPGAEYHQRDCSHVPAGGA